MTSGSASAKLHATSQPKNEPRPRPTYVYIPPADGRCFASSAIEKAVKSTAIMANTTASGVMRAGERGGGADREGGRDGRCHVRDRLEQHFGQADRVARKGRGCGV